MPGEVTFSISGLFGFLLALARVSGVIAFVPFPGFHNGPDIARVVISVTLTFCLMAKWPSVAAPGFGQVLLYVLGEAAFGLTIGLFISFLLEAFQMAAQALSLQAGYSYASTIDPTTQADSGVIAVVFQLLAGVCFFLTGTDREVLRSLSASFDRFPPGSFALTASVSDAIVAAGSTMFSTGLRIAFPVIAFLLLVDFALALLGRMQSQLQLLSLAFPAKMLAALMLLASLAALFPTLFQYAAKHTMQSLGRVLGA